jgi:hypothetical protein
MKKLLKVNHPHIWGSCDYCGMDFWSDSQRIQSSHYLLDNDALSLYVVHLVGKGDVKCQQYAQMSWEEIVDAAN